MLGHLDYAGSHGVSTADKSQIGLYLNQEDSPEQSESTVYGGGLYGGGFSLSLEYSPEPDPHNPKSVDIKCESVGQLSVRLSG